MSTFAEVMGVSYGRGEKVVKNVSRSGDDRGEEFFLSRVTPLGEGGMVGSPETPLGGSVKNGLHELLFRCGYVTMPCGASVGEAGRNSGIADRACSSWFHAMGLENLLCVETLAC